MGETPDGIPSEFDASEAAVIAEIGRIVSSTVDIGDVYERFAAEVRKLVPFERLVIGTYDAQDDTITNAYASGRLGVAAFPIGEARPVTGSLSEKAARSREARMYSATSADALLRRYPELAAGIAVGLRASLVVPLIASGSLVGIMTMRSTESDAYIDLHLHRAISVGRQIAGAIATAWAFASLRESEESRRALVEASPLAITSIDRRGRVRSWNPAAERMFGWSEAEVRGRPPPGIPPDRRGERETTLERVRRGEVFPGIETTRLHKDGTPIDVVMSRAPLFDVEGNIRGAMAVMANISDRKRAEAHRRQSDEQFRLTFELAPNGIAITGLDGRFERLNQAFCDLLGFSAPELVGMSLADICHVDDQEQAVATVEAIRTGSVPHVELEQRYVREDGESVVVISTVGLIRNAANEPRRLLVQVFDITERRQLEEQLGQSQRLEAIGQLAGGVAHDYNNQLTIIASYCEFLRNALQEGDPLLALVAQIEAAQLQGATLARQLLAFSRLQVLTPALMQLNGVVTGLEPMLRRLIGENIEVVTALAPALGPVRADASEVGRVIMNLVLNARDAMPEGGTLTIETANVDLDATYTASHVAVEPGPHAMLAVTDTGTGMDPETAARVFEPFFTTKAPGEGSGLGLSTAYGIVKQSGGHIWVYSEPGLGTTFKVYLPRVDDAIEEVKPQPDEAQRLDGTETVLVVEDEEAVRLATVRAIEERGYTVLVASDGVQAEKVAREHEGPIHLLVTDVVMPAMGGAELAKRLGRSRPETQVLYISGYPSGNAIEADVRVEGIAYLQKPFAPRSLVAAARRLLDSPSPSHDPNLRRSEERRRSGDAQ